MLPVLPAVVSWHGEQPSRLERRAGHTDLGLTRSPAQSSSDRPSSSCHCLRSLILERDGQDHLPLPHCACGTAWG